MKDNNGAIVTSYYYEVKRGLRGIRWIMPRILWLKPLPHGSIRPLAPTAEVEGYAFCQIESGRIVRLFRREEILELPYAL